MKSLQCTRVESNKLLYDPGFATWFFVCQGSGRGNCENDFLADRVFFFYIVLLLFSFLVLTSSILLSMNIFWQMKWIFIENLLIHQIVSGPLSEFPDGVFWEQTVFPVFSWKPPYRGIYLFGIDKGLIKSRKIIFSIMATCC